MPQQAINATLDLEGLEVIAVAAFGELVELVVQSVSTREGAALVAWHPSQPRPPGRGG